MPNTQYFMYTTKIGILLQVFQISHLIVATKLAIPHLSSYVPPRLVDWNHLSYSISGQNNVQFHHSKHHTLWTWKLFPSHICLDLNSKSTEIWPIWDVNIFCLCARTLFMRGIVCTLCTRRLINIYERCLTIKSHWLNHQKNWNASEGLFCLFNFYGCLLEKIWLCPWCWPCRRRWWWRYYVDLNLDLTERAAEAVVQVAASQTQQQRNYHHHHLHHHHLQLYHFVTLHQLDVLTLRCQNRFCRGVFFRRQFKL